MKSLKGKRVLVTGGGGFIGSHLTERLAVLGASVRVFLRYNSRGDSGFVSEFPQGLMDSIEVYYGELRELETIKNVMKDIEVVFNLAALVGIPYSYKHPQEVVETNTVGTLNVLTAAKDEGVKKFVQTSTSEVYGSARYVPIDEKHELQPQSPYSASKIGADALALSFYHSFGMPVAVIRPFNTYGPRQSARAVIPTIITQTLAGKEVHLGSTHVTRDFTYISDTVEGFIRIARSEKSTGEVINIGSGTEISIADLTKTIFRIVGGNFTLKTDSKRKRPSKSEVTRLWADNTKAKTLIGWSPKVPLKEGIKKTVEYISGNMDRYNPTEYVI